MRKRKLFAGSDLFFDDGEGTAAFQGIAIGSPAENLDGDIGADTGAKSATDAIFLVVDNRNGIFGVALLFTETQQLPRTGRGTQGASLASVFVDLDQILHGHILIKGRERNRAQHIAFYPKKSTDLVGPDFHGAGA
jgi:hypothetical protein